MSKTVQWKRGNTSQNSTYVGSQGEITVNTDNWNLHVHDGVTAGGWVIDSANGGGTFSNLTVTGNIAASGNVSAAYFIGNGSQLTGLPASYTDSNVVVLLSDFGANSIDTTGNVTAGYLFGNGSQLTGITSSYGNSNVAAYLPTYTGNLTAGNILTDNYRYANGSSIFGNLAIGGADDLFLINQVDGTMGIVQTNGSPIRLVFANATSGHYSNIGFFDLADDRFLMGCLAANSSITIRAGNSSITMDDATGQMTFSPNAAGNIGYDFSASGEIDAVAYYARADFPVGYSFKTPGTDTGLSHYYTEPGNLSSISVLQLRHDNAVVAEFTSNLTTQLSGNLVVSQDGDTYGTFPNAYVQVYSNVNSYSQMVLQNINNSSLASTDIVATAGNGTDEQYFLDLGIASNNYSYPGYGLIKPNDVYLLAVGDNITGPGAVDSGNLIIGSTTGNIKFFVGAPEDANVITTIDSTSMAVNGNITAGNITATRTMLASFRTYANAAIFGYGTDGSGLEGAPIVMSGNSTQSVILTTGLANNVASNLTVKTLNSNITLQISGADKTWTFDTAGNLTAPGNITATGAITAGGKVYARYFDLQGGEAEGNSIGQLGYGGNIVQLNGINGVNIVTADGEGGPSWAFDTAGNLTAPGNITATRFLTTGNSVAVGERVGSTNQGSLAVAIGSQAGQTDQGLQATAVGSGAGSDNQGAGTVAIGTNAGAFNQGLRATAVGSMAGGLNQGDYAVALGNFAGGTNQANNSIIINATGLSLDANTSGFFVAPIAENTSGNIVTYNTSTKELTYSNTISISGNITGGNLITDGSLTFPNSGVLTSDNGQLIFGTGNFDLRTAIASAGAGYDFTIGAGSINGSATSAAVTTIHGGAAGVEGITGGNAILVGGGAITSGVGGNAIVRAGYGIAGYGNVLIENGTNTWTFDTNGNLTVPGQLNFTASPSIISGVGNITTVTGQVGGYDIGYRDVPQVAFTSNATLALTDAGKHYYSANSANVITIPNNSTVSFNIGTAVSIVQQGTANLTIAPGSGVTLYMAGNSTAGSRTLGNYGMATLMKVATDTWFINGTSLT